MKMLLENDLVVMVYLNMNCKVKARKQKGKSDPDRRFYLFPKANKGKSSFRCISNGDMSKTGKTERKISLWTR